MKSHLTVGLILTALVLAAANPGFAQVGFYEWQPTDAQTWNADANWLQAGVGSFTPDADSFAGEAARVNNGGTAIVSDDVPRVVQIESLNGAIDIQTGGQLDTFVDAISGGNGSLVVGGAGAVNLSGSGQLTIGGNVSNGGTVQLTGTGASFSVANNFSSTGTLTAGITDASNHSTIAVSGNATLGGTLNVDFSGVTPQVGDSWNLIDATEISGGYQAINVTGNVPSGVGVFFETQAGGANGKLGQVTADLQLVLTVNARTGATSIENRYVGASASLDGYLITPTGGAALNPGAWTSFRDAGDTNWTESNPGPNSLGELNLTSSGTVASGASFSLGDIYDFTPAAIAQEAPAPVFEYHVPGGATRTGLVEIVGPSNNVVLLVDPATGAAAIQNQSIFDVEIDGYLVTSDSSSLDASGWDSLSSSLGNGWTESNPAANHIGELNLGDTLALTGGSVPISLGSLFDFDDINVEQDLEFEFHLTNGDTIAGVVTYGEFSLDAADADFNADSDVDGQDFLTWQQFVGFTGPSNLQPFGDANSDGEIDGLDLSAWESQYGIGSLSALAATVAVPEPTSIGLVLMALTALACSQRGTKIA